jgi:hypothetical protein
MGTPINIASVLFGEATVDPGDLNSDEWLLVLNRVVGKLRDCLKIASITGFAPIEQLLNCVENRTKRKTDMSKVTFAGNGKIDGATRVIHIATIASVIEQKETHASHRDLNLFITKDGEWLLEHTVHEFQLKNGGRVFDFLDDVISCEYSLIAYNSELVGLFFTASRAYLESANPGLGKGPHLGKRIVKKAREVLERLVAEKSSALRWMTVQEECIRQIDDRLG